MAAITTKRAARARANRLALRPTRQLPTSPELNDYARARLDPLYGYTVVEDDPYAPDARFDWDDDSPPIDCPYRVGKRNPRRCVRQNGHDGPHEPAPQPTPRKTAQRPALAPETVAYDGGALPPCPRCKRTDWQTAKGRDWHLENYPACANAPRQAHHQYVTIGG